MSAVSKTLEFLFAEAKGIKLKQTFNVSFDTYQDLIKHLKVSYVKSPGFSRLHNPFLIFDDLDGVTYVFSISAIVSITVKNKAAHAG